MSSLDAKIPPEPKSKRTPVRLRHKIEKASAAKQRKDRRSAKKNPEWRSRLKKDPGIPNLFPYKDRLLGEIEEKKRLKQEEAARLREEAKARRKSQVVQEGGDEDDIDGSRIAEDEDLLDDEMGEGDIDERNPMAALLASAKSRAAEYEANSINSPSEMEEDREDDEWGGIDPSKQEDLEVRTGAIRKDSSRKAFDKTFKQVVERADVVLYVLDARDPEGTRSIEVERMVMASDGGEKRLILILNKIDLVPPAVLKGWLAHLRRYFTTVPFRASNPASNAQTFKDQPPTQVTSSTLFKLLKSHAQSKQLKRAISVGVIGYPNVGKSSVINALTSKFGGFPTACPVGAEAGVTTSLREVKLDSKLKLLDSPGIVFPSSTDGSKASRIDEQSRLVLLNAVPPKQIEDPVSAVSLLLKRLSASEELFAKLLEVYGLSPLLSLSGDPTTDFLVQVARKRGRLSKGGVPNIRSAATTVITDWRDGRIQGWTSPPAPQIATPTTAGETSAATQEPAGDQKEIVTEWAKEFKLEGLWGDGEGHGDDEEMRD
ncbi:hypothetical protein FGG08_001722 [Glutinoglossum americanum]|uniref:CP-type G domain-containing protein n=1 Tax=Glutinoglossum americanum TaxID=1670608 RepID=A0A9P8IAU9_9PEZI|nr:hypothetical protein FGG08_001722 [Glutinoglossum americanum]